MDRFVCNSSRLPIAGNSVNSKLRPRELHSVRKTCIPEINFPFRLVKIQFIENWLDSWICIARQDWWRFVPNWPCHLLLRWSLCIQMIEQPCVILRVTLVVPMELGPSKPVDCLGSCCRRPLLSLISLISSMNTWSTFCLVLAEVST